MLTLTLSLYSLGTYSLSISSFRFKAFCSVIKFLVFWSICWDLPLAVLRMVQCILECIYPGVYSFDRIFYDTFFWGTSFSYIFQFLSPFSWYCLPLIYLGICVVFSPSVPRLDWFAGQFYMLFPIPINIVRMVYLSVSNSKVRPPPLTSALDKTLNSNAGNCRVPLHCQHSQC